MKVVLKGGMHPLTPGLWKGKSLFHLVEEYTESSNITKWLLEKHTKAQKQDRRNFKKTHGILHDWKQNIGEATLGRYSQMRNIFVFF